MYTNNVRFIYTRRLCESRRRNARTTRSIRIPIPDYFRRDPSRDRQTLTLGYISVRDPKTGHFRISTVYGFERTETSVARSTLVGFRIFSPAPSRTSERSEFPSIARLPAVTTWRNGFVVTRCSFYRGLPGLAGRLTPRPSRPKANRDFRPPSRSIDSRLIDNVLRRYAPEKRVRDMNPQVRSYRASQSAINRTRCRPNVVREKSCRRSVFVQIVRTLYPTITRDEK